MSKREPPVAAHDRDNPATATSDPDPEESALEAMNGPRRSTTLQWNPSLGLGASASRDGDPGDSASISGARRVTPDTGTGPVPIVPPSLPHSELRPDGPAPSRATLPSAIDTPPSTLSRADSAPAPAGHATPVVPGAPGFGRSVEAPAPPSTRLFGSPPSSRRMTPPPLPKVPGAMPPRNLTPGPRPALRGSTPTTGSTNPTPRSLSPVPRRDQILTPRPGTSPGAQGTATATPGAEADPRGTKNPALRATGFSGLSQGVPLSHWLELVQIGRRDAVISLRTKNGDESLIWCHEGEIVDAQTGSLLGEDAVYRILELEDGDVSIEFAPCERARTIDTPTFALMLEASRRKDHAAESSGPRAVPRLPGERLLSEDTPVSRPITGVARPYDTRITSTPPDTGVVSSTRPHVRNLEPASQPLPSSSSQQWKHPHAFGIAFALVCGGLALWLLWRPTSETPSPALKPPAPLARPAPAPKRAPVPPAASATPRPELEKEAPTPSAPPVVAEAPEPEPEAPAADPIERPRATAPARARRPVYNPPPPPRPAPVKEASASEPAEPATTPAEAKKEEPRVRLIDERKPRVQVIEELPPDVRVIE